MAITPGSRLGVYEITAKLGEGGMGEVYRARDPKLNRDVALKVLPDSFAGDPDRLARFTREAHTLASLNHPNIAAIHGLEESSGARALVMELVEGEDLSAKIRSGSGNLERGTGMPLDEVLSIARQIAEALEAAHEQGIIHRDLKPANIKVRPDGTVKVLDFGLAKALEPVELKGSTPQEATVTTPAMTQVGMILGTAAYMSPEQARGKAVDKRADIWAFGCVLFEMLTGRAPFAGDTTTDVLGSVVKLEPEWSRLPADTPQPVRRLLQRCLHKDPRARLRDIGDARFDLAEPADANGVTGGAAARRRFVAIPLVLLTIIVAALSIPAVQHLREAPPPPPPEMRVDLALPGFLGEFDLSPEGDRLAFVSSAGGPQQLWIRALNAEQAQPLAGTEGASFPFWSPDGRTLGFFAGAKLKRIDVTGGVPQAVTDAAETFGFGGAWNADGVILFAKGLGSLFRVSASGGEPVAVTRLSKGHVSHLFPKFLPDGRHFVFFAQGHNPGIHLGSLDEADSKRLTTSGSFGVWAPPGLLVYVLQGRLVASRLDVTRGALTGEPIPVADSLVVEVAGIGVGGFSVSTTGRVAYVTVNNGARPRLTWFDRSGRDLGAPADSDASEEMTPELSPDGRTAAIDRTSQNNRDVWLIDLTRKVRSRFTFDTAMDGFPVWSPDGTQIAFESDRKGVFDLYVKPANGSGAEQLLFESPIPKWPMDWSDDGRFLLYYQAADLLALPLTGDRTPVAVVNTPFTENNGQFSPDGRWVAYQSNESGAFEIYVQAFPLAGAKWQISHRGGTAPRWRADGRELFYIGPDGKLMATTVPPSATAFRVGPPVALFATGMRPDGFVKHEYAVARDGRFLMPAPSQTGGFSPVTLLLNWRPPAP